MCVGVAYLESLDNVNGDLFNDVPIVVADGDGRVEYEYDVTATVADHCG